MAIVVGTNWDAYAQDLGRGSPLGNPCGMMSEADRDRVCDQYAVWFEERVKAGDALVMNELRRLYKIAKRGELVLGCYCAPKRCHGETIKEFLEKHL